MCTACTIIEKLDSKSRQNRLIIIILSLRSLLYCFVQNFADVTRHFVSTEINCEARIDLTRIKIEKTFNTGRYIEALFNHLTV